MEENAPAPPLFRRQFGYIGTHRNHLHAQADSGQKSPQVDRCGSRLQSHHKRADGVPQQREAEDWSASKPVRDRTENKRPHEESRKKSGYKTREAIDSQETSGRRCENAAAVEGRSDIGGEKQIVELETRAQRQQDNQFADIAELRQSVQTRRHIDPSPCRSQRAALLHARPSDYEQMPRGKSEGCPKHNVGGLTSDTRKSQQLLYRPAHVAREFLDNFYARDLNRFRFGAEKSKRRNFSLEITRVCISKIFR